jgi:hypothetical protein
MTGIVLALSGLTCGDGGTGAGASVEPASISFEGRWVGTAQRGAEKPIPIEWDNIAGSLTLVKAWKSDASFQASGPRAVTLTLQASVYRGTFTLDRDRLILRANVDGNILVVTLRPAAPRKP